MAVTANGLNISDNSKYLVEEIQYRQFPTRIVTSQPISTRPGDKLIATEWSNKEIDIKGRIFGTTPADLQVNIDTLQQNLAVQSLALILDNGRTYTATLTDFIVPTQFYTLSMANYEAKFLCVDPFAYGSAVTASGSTVSGTVTFSGSLTISGTVFVSPVLTINPTGANTGNSGINYLTITQVTTGELVTISGIFNYASDIIIDYNNFLITNSGINTDFSGIFSRWQPGVNNYLITVTSGIKQGFNYKWTYSPRFYQ